MNEFAEESFAERLAQGFAEGGWMMYPIGLLGCLLPLVALVLLGVGVVSQKNRALPLAVGLLIASVLPASLGLGAAVLARHDVEAVITAVSPEDRDTIRMGAEAEVLSLHVAGFGAALFPGFLACVLLGIGLGRLERFRAPAPGAGGTTL